VIRSELATVAGLKTFSSCPVPLNAIVNREIYADGHHHYWVLLDTTPIDDPTRGRQDYARRSAIEERHRQLKCFSDLAAFSARAFSLMVHKRSHIKGGGLTPPLTKGDAIAPFGNPI